MAAVIDAFASMPHYREHIEPVWEALAPQVRGTFHTGQPTGSGPIIVAGYTDLARVRPRPAVFLEHGAGQTYRAGHPSYSGGRNRGNVGLFLSPSERVAENNRRAYPNAEHAVVGCPKLDAWIDYQPHNATPVVAASFHWGGPVPTALPFYAKALPELAKRFNVIGHAHPRALSRVRRIYEKVGIEVVPEFTEVLRRADVYVCDNSSTIFEFAATGRPVVLMNAPQYRKLLHGFRFGWAAEVGIQVDKPADLPAAITEALVDSPEQRRAREAVIEQVYAYRDGKSAQRAATAIESWLFGQELAVAA